METSRNQRKCLTRPLTEELDMPKYVQWKMNKTSIHLTCMASGEVASAENGWGWMFREDAVTYALEPVVES